MITRIEIDGFKSFQDFAMDVGSFVVILGPNASGKSNLFDAIRLLSNLAGTDLRSAVRGLRGEPHELFRRQPDGSPGTRITFAVELLLDPEVRDPWGAMVRIAHSRVRYEVAIERRTDERGIERLLITREEATPIFRQDDRWRPGDRAPSGPFKKALMKYGRKTPWLTTSTSGPAAFQIGQDGRQGRSRSAEAAEATVLSSITSAEFPHLYALREELRSWRFMQLDPAALRQPSPTTAADELEPDGSNLATVLARIQAETATDDRPQGALSDIGADLAALIPGVVDLRVVEERLHREYRVDIGLKDGPPFSSRVVSDGTLRVLALLAMLHHPRHRGLVCFEEPENGIHPFRLKTMIRRLRDLISDPHAEEVDENEPLSQLLMNSHSPVVLSCLDHAEVVFADVLSVVDPESGSVTRKTRMRPVRPVRQGAMAFDGSGNGIAAHVSSYEVEQYLASVDPEA